MVYKPLAPGGNANIAINGAVDTVDTEVFGSTDFVSMEAVGRSCWVAQTHVITSSATISGGNIFPSRVKRKGSLISSPVDIVLGGVVDAAAVGLACLWKRVIPSGLRTAETRGMSVVKNKNSAGARNIFKL